MQACAHIIDVAHKKGKKVGICGQAPSDYPEFAAFLVQKGIDSISINPDAIVSTTRKILEQEKALGLAPRISSPGVEQDAVRAG